MAELQIQGERGNLDALLVALGMASPAAAPGHAALLAAGNEIRRLQAVERAYQALLTVARCAEADLTGIMPEFEPSGAREHPGWQTLAELQAARAAAPPPDAPAQPPAADAPE